MLLRRVFQVLLTLTAAAVAGAAALATAYALRPAFTLEMDRPMPGVLSGFYDTERAGDDTFAWSGRQASMQLRGLDRRGEWQCVIRLRGGRPSGVELPEVVMAVDGVVIGRHATSNDFSEIGVAVAANVRNGASITLTTPTFVPGGGDTRELGVFVDRWHCAPAPGFSPRPPSKALGVSALSVAAFGAVLLVMQAPALALMAGIASVAALLAIPLTRGMGSYSAFAQPIEWVAAWLGMGLCATLLIGRYRLGRAFSAQARVALFVTTVVLFLKLVALLHPSKLLIDALFHAHRMEWVLEGRYFFTQPMPSGVRFPYAIGLYVFSAPWSYLTTDLVSLLRIIVTAAEAVGGLLLYYLIARFRGDRTVAVVATVLYSVAPTTFEIVGNANLTNAFGQSVSLAALAAAVALPLGAGRWGPWIVLTLLIAFGLLCHISTLTLLGAILSVLCVLYLFAGKPPLRREGWMLAAALAVAALLALGLYYGHFSEAFRSATRVPAVNAASEAASTQVPLPERVSDAARLIVRAVGWPMVLLAVSGSLVWWRKGWRDRLGLSVAALGITFLLFTALITVTPVQQNFYRYSLEFITRVTLATYPFIVIWAALGCVWTWRQQGLTRIAGVTLVAAAVWVGGDAWLNWLR